VFAGQKKPAVHGPVQLAEPKPAVEPKKPAAHGEHAVAGATAKEPAGHCVHVGDVR
jgi:hypothetical protein